MKNIFRYFIVLVFLIGVSIVFSKDVSAQGRCRCRIGLFSAPACNFVNNCAPGYTPVDTCSATLIEPGVYSCDGTCTCVGGGVCSDIRQACTTPSQ